MSNGLMCKAVDFFLSPLASSVACLFSPFLVLPLFHEGETHVTAMCFHL